MAADLERVSRKISFFCLTFVGSLRCPIGLTLKNCSYGRFFIRAPDGLIPKTYSNKKIPVTRTGISNSNIRSHAVTPLFAVFHCFARTNMPSGIFVACAVALAVGIYVKRFDPQNIFKQKNPCHKDRDFFVGSGGRDRTYDRSVNSRLLYR